MNVTCKFRDDALAVGIVRATPAHGPALAAIHTASFAAPERWDANAFATQLALPGVFGLLDPAGGMVLARIAADEAEILTFAVMPDARRAGRARNLLGAAQSLAVAAGARTIFLEVAAGNGPALALYAAVGYLRVGERPAYYAGGTTALVMARPLTRDAVAGE